MGPKKWAASGTAGAKPTDAHVPDAYAAGPHEHANAIRGRSARGTEGL